MPKRVVPFRVPVRRRIHESVAEQLRDAILDGRFKPGDKLPPERELAEEFQVNRTSVREAIKVLDGLTQHHRLGLVHITHYPGEAASADRVVQLGGRAFGRQRLRRVGQRQGQDDQRLEPVC